MVILPFGSKKKKLKRLIEEERFEDVLSIVTKDKKSLNSLMELLEEPSPGIRGDVLLVLSMVTEKDPSPLGPHMEMLLQKAISLTRDNNPYVKENAMVLSYNLVRLSSGRTEKLKGMVLEDLLAAIKDGDRNTKAFAVMMLGELGAAEARREIESLVEVEDKVILPFEGKKWVPLGEIAREALEKL
ncbi:hypothetical protein E3E36_08575 [Thermococcus sp. M36]|nr:hypothetical protein [Thermococcus sp. M36]